VDESQEFMPLAEWDPASWTQGFCGGRAAQVISGSQITSGPRAIPRGVANKKPLRPERDRSGKGLPRSTKNRRELRFGFERILSRNSRSAADFLPPPNLRPYFSSFSVKLTE
jgi:hypothetical protein